MILSKDFLAIRSVTSEIIEQIYFALVQHKRQLDTIKMVLCLLYILTSVGVMLTPNSVEISFFCVFRFLCSIVEHVRGPVTPFRLGHKNPHGFP